MVFFKIALGLLAPRVEERVIEYFNGDTSPASPLLCADGVPSLAASINAVLPYGSATPALAVYVPASAFTVSLWPFQAASINAILPSPSTPSYHPHQRMSCVA